MIFLVLFVHLTAYNEGFFLRLPIPAVVLLFPCASCGPRGPENFSQHLFSALLTLAKQLFSSNHSVMSDSLQPHGQRSLVGYSLWSCLTLWDPVACRTLGFRVHHQLQGLAQTHVHRISDAIQPS